MVLNHLCLVKQLVYTSTCTVFQSEDALATLLEQSRHYNAIDGVTGLLWCDGFHFMQVLEGYEPSVVEAYRKISLDPRHHDITVTSYEDIERRDFDGWSMACRRSFESDIDYDARVRHFMSKAEGQVRTDFYERMGIDVG